MNSFDQIITINKNRQLYWLGWLLSSAQSSVVHYFRWIYSPVLTSFLASMQYQACRHLFQTLLLPSCTIRMCVCVCVCVWGGVLNGLKQASAAPHLCIDKIKTTSPCKQKLAVLNSILQNIRRILCSFLFLTACNGLNGRGAYKKHKGSKTSTVRQCLHWG